MKSRVIKIEFFLVVVISMMVLPTLLSGQESPRQDAATAPAVHDENPLLEEMIKLDSVFREVVSGVSLGDGARVYNALEIMHGTMEKTHEGIHHGTVKVPKNAARMKEFMDLDTKFHARLESLSAAAHQNDQQAMLKLTKVLLDGCVQCHRTFRK